MSTRQHHDALLDGYRPPIFPPACAALRALYDSTRVVNGAWLEAIAEHIPGFLKCERLTTSDRYAWFWAMGFRVAHGTMRVLIPWSQDWAEKDGTKADRSIAVYLADVSEEDAAAVLEQLVAATATALDPNDTLD